MISFLQAMNASAAMCGYASYQGPQGQYCVKRSGKDSSPENCGCRAGPGTGVKRTSVWPILQSPGLWVGDDRVLRGLLQLGGERLGLRVPAARD